MPFLHYLLAKRKKTHSRTLTYSSDIYDQALSNLQKILQSQDHTLSSFGLPVPSPRYTSPIELKMETKYDEKQCDEIATENEKKFNAEQLHFYTCLMSQIYPNEYHKQNDEPLTNVFFLDALGGTGKTFVANTVLARIRSKGHIAIATAFSGIAALLLTGGRTLHSRFKIPLDVKDTSV